MNSSGDRERITQLLKFNLVFVAGLLAIQALDVPVTDVLFNAGGVLLVMGTLLLHLFLLSWDYDDAGSQTTKEEFAVLLNALAFLFVASSMAFPSISPYITIISNNKSPPWVASSLLVLTYTATLIYYWHENVTIDELGTDRTEEWKTYAVALAVYSIIGVLIGVVSTVQREISECSYLHVS